MSGRRKEGAGLCESEARVGGADGEAPGARRRLQQALAAAKQAAAKLGFVSLEAQANFFPRGGEGALDVVHAAIVRILLGLLSRVFEDGWRRFRGRGRGVGGGWLCRARRAIDR